MIDCDELCTKALDTWGFDTQMDIAIEEMSELIKAIIKYRRYPTFDRAMDVAEEYADVQLMLKQIRVGMLQKYPEFDDVSHKTLLSKIDWVKQNLNIE